MVEGYKHTEVGEIPIEWDCEPLKEFLSLISYGFTNPMPTTSFGIFMITANDISEGRIKYETARKTSETAYKTLLTNKSRPKKNDILLTKDGSLGRLALVGDETICINQSVAVIRPNDKVIPLFLKKLLESDYYQRVMIENAGGSTIKHIYITIVDKMPVGIPKTKTEQTAIATALNDADAIITALEKLIAKKKAIKQGAMQELLRPKEGWVEKTIDDLADVIGGGTPSSFNNKYWNGYINWFTPTEVGLTKYLIQSSRKITEEGYTNCSAKMLPVGTVLLTSRAGIGDIGILKIEACTNQGFQSLLAKPNTDNEFLYYLVSTLKNKLLQYASGSTFLEISPAKLKAIEVIVPKTEKEQSDIAQILSDMDSEIVTLEQKLAKQKQIKQGMMQVLLTGKIRLK